MGILKAGLVAALALCWAQPAASTRPSDWEPQIGEAARRFGLPADWIRKVMAAESGGRTHLAGRPIRSRAGAMGLMQLMPGTWAEVRQRLALGSDPDDPRDNILAGAFYLRAMYDRFGYPGLFAAYNAGPGRYAEHLRGRALPGETLAYVRTVTAGEPRSLADRAAQVRPESRPAPGLFVVHRGALQGELAAGVGGPSPLFVPVGGTAAAPHRSESAEPLGPGVGSSRTAAD